MYFFWTVSFNIVCQHAKAAGKWGQDFPFHPLTVNRKAGQISFLVGVFHSGMFLQIKSKGFEYIDIMATSLPSLCVEARTATPIHVPKRMCQRRRQCRELESWNIRLRSTKMTSCSAAVSRKHVSSLLDKDPISSRKGQRERKRSRLMHQGRCTCRGITIAE